jgi:hypothetical protein
MEPSAHIERLREALSAGRGTLVLGPAFSNGLEPLDILNFADTTGEQLVDRSGWDNLSLDDKHKLLLQGLGHAVTSQLLANQMPTPKALGQFVREFHEDLLKLPFSVVIDGTLNDLAQATLSKTDQRIRLLSRDQDLVTRPNALPGEKTLVKLFGDLWTDDPAFSTEQIEKRAAANPGLSRLVTAAVSQGPIVFYGFSIIDPVFQLFGRLFGPLSGTTIVATRIDNALWKQQGRSLGFHIIEAATWTEVERKIGLLCGTISPDISLPDISQLTRDVDQLVAQHLGTNPLLHWAHRPVSELENLPSEEIDTVKESVRFMSALAERGILVPGVPAGLAAEICLRAGDLPLSRQALELSVSSLIRSDEIEANAASAIGRTLNRMGDHCRARTYLEWALSARSASETDARADDLAWLSRCVIQEIDDLNGVGRARAVMELIANFLKEQAQGVDLAQIESEEPTTRRSIYYINLRLGRIMAMAAEMAQATGNVFAEKAVELLVRAIEMEPGKPDGYKAIRVLLTNREYATADSKRWMSLVAGAPPAVQRRLGSR